MPKATPWTPERLAMLRAEWESSASTAEIGRRMGTSKGAVIGKARRLGLPAREAPANIEKQIGVRVRQKAQPSAGRDAMSPGQSRPVTTCRPCAAQLGAAAATALDVSSSPNLPGAAAMPPRVFLDRQCQYITHSADRMHRFCEAPVVANAKGRPSAYCAAHYAMCHTAPGKNPNNPPPPTWLKNRLAMRAHG
jgi:GcrA cell cycle regulator